MSARRDKRQPLDLFLAALVVQVAAHLAVPVYHVIPRAWTLSAVVPIAGGLVLMLVADHRFKAAGTAVRCFEKPSSLVTDGVFRMSRNPMYVGMFLILVGAALGFGTLSPFGVPLLFAWLATRHFIRAEEATLHEAFGPAYEEYRRQVRRWL
jgi:protein-S-isoprenylcysteine O-methyltransferase Ste14